jgi:integrase
LSMFWRSRNAYDFRHALACRMLNNGAQMSHAQAVLGHQSLATTSRIYAKYDVRNLRAAYDQYSGTPEELSEAALTSPLKYGDSASPRPQEP